jgi:hypothetical protein
MEATTRLESDASLAELPSVKDRLKAVIEGELLAAPLAAVETRHSLVSHAQEVAERALERLASADMPAIEALDGEIAEFAARLVKLREAGQSSIH